VAARVPGLDKTAFDAVIGEASELCSVSRLFAGAKITVDAAGTRTVTTGTALALTLPRPAETTLTAVLVLATAVWVGGLMAIFVVARVAHATLGASERVAFFRGLGRAYGLAGGVALTVALASGAVLAATYRWDGSWRRRCGGARGTPPPCAPRSPRSAWRSSPSEPSSQPDMLCFTEPLYSEIWGSGVAV
jgi:hypothetical protein